MPFSFYLKGEKMGIMSPDEFAEKMRELITAHTRTFKFISREASYLDADSCHSEMDELMCKVLTQLGYAEGVDIFRNTEKYYG